ncbi:MAG: CO dehydrogenase/CO-methylating acetyl-CoA synthase complex subunit beta [Dehalococcoidia bacterium]|nr:CO dehydrogenase/CO-methylating acetyl-CoA synthase complex subunit beta [Chloroflexota bacterium]MCK4242458.1 CO dehydrogenase/CO-methylating acetyl-CoA synthase complex subunit beta [Dehalococcoidia bacterium]
MSRFIATSAIRGAHGVVKQAEDMLKDALEKFGADVPVVFVDKEGVGSTYYLPVIYGYSGHKVEKLGDLTWPLEHAKSLLAPVPSDNLWLPYLGEIADAGVATFFAEEIIKGIEFVKGKQPEVHNGYKFNGPISDPQTRSWGIQLVDGSMPGFAAVIGAAKSNEVAVKIVRELQSKGQLVFLSSMSNGRSIVDQLLEEGVDLGYHTFTVPYGTDTESVVYAAGFASRAAFSFGNVKPGNWREMLLYNKFRCFAFALCLGPMDDLKWATGAGAITYGFPAICDTVVPNILPTGITKYEHVVSMPFDDIPGKDDMERAERLIQRCIEVRGIKIKIPKVDIPVAFGPAFEGEVVRRENLRAEAGGKGGTCFEWLAMKDMDKVQDGKIAIVGPNLDSFEEGVKMPLGIVVAVAGRKMQKDFEPVLERQIHHFINGAEGVQHIAQRDIAWLRFSKSAVDKGFGLKHLGVILHTNLHNDFGAIVDKVQITLYTELDKVEELRDQARGVYHERDARIAGMTDEAVDTYYSCTLCQSFAPNHVCVINPERTGLCGAYSWLDCRAAFEISPTGPNQPVPKGRCIDPVLGEWEGVNSFVYEHSNRNVERFTIYSLMDSPMTTCGCCECVMALIPEANGVMIVNRDDYSMTPCGMTFTTLMGTVGGGLQTPGMMGHAKLYVTSKKFIPVEGGIKRVVWLSKNVKEEFAEELKEVCEREGVPDLMDKIADGTVATTVEELLPFLEEKGHPALTMESII